MAEDRRYSPAEVPVTAEDVAHRGFSTAFRGFDPNQVRQYLTRVAESLRAARDRQRELEQQLRDTEARAAKPNIDEATLTNALGEHTARIIRSAHEAAADIRTKAEESVEHILKDAHDEASRLRADAERALADRVSEADAETNGVRQAAEADAQGIRRRAQDQADRLLERARAQSKDVLAEAGALRNRVMGDLMRRRRIALSQVEQLQAGRDRLLEAYRIVRRTLDEATDALERAESDARAAAEAAAHRVAAEPEPTPDELGLAAPPNAAPEPEPESEHEQEPAPEPDEPVYSRPPDTISSVRLVPATEASDDDSTAAEVPTDVRPTLKVVQPPSDVESVRVFRADSPPPPPTPPPPPPPPPPPAAQPELPAKIEVSVETVSVATDSTDTLPEGQPDAADELFAKLRAEQDADAPVEDPAESAEPEVPEDVLVTNRDEALAPIAAALTRKLKRVLQDEQNEVLDRIRREGGHRPSFAAAFPADVDSRARYREAAFPHLIEAAGAGSASAGGTRADNAVVGELADELADAVFGPLARRLEEALEEAASMGEDEAEVTARVGAAYRDLKGGRLDRLAADHVGSAYAAGAFVAWAPGTPLRWIVRDIDGQCPDCDDNALAGPTPRGEAFPTGQLRPPAHAGCRCLLAPASA